MECKELIDVKEESGWISDETFFTYGRPGFMFMESGQILFRKPDNSPARKFQIFFVAREGALKQITKGADEVVGILSANTRGVLSKDLSTSHWNVFQMSALNINMFTYTVRIPKSVSLL